MEIEDNPTLLRDLQALARTPEFRRLKRHVFAVYSQGDEGEARDSALQIGEQLSDWLMQFDPQHGT